MAARFLRTRPTPPRESGVTILIVALTLVALLSMAALAIDVVNLYVARSETQRAADAAALVGAKALVDYGVTSGDTTLQAAAQTYAITMATAAAQQNLIAGQAVPSGGVTVIFPNAGTTRFAVNPQVRVTVQRTGLPSFLARIWSATTNSASATALAEAYNPSNAASVSAGAAPPVAPQCVKPWLLPNMDPINAGTTFFDRTTGAITTPGLVGSGGVVGEEIRMLSACGSNCSPVNPPSVVLPPGAPIPTVSYYPLDLGGSTTYQNNIASCNARYVTCGDTVSLDTTDGSVEPNPNHDAVRALIHASGAGYGQGQDQLLTGTTPFQTLAGDNNLLVTGGLVADNAAVSTSASVVTVPVYDSTGNIAPSNPVTVIGFLQGFVTMVGPTGRPRMRILNVAGCGGASGTPIVGAGGSPVPVRLIR